MSIHVGLDLSHLYAYPIFHSKSTVQSHQELSRTLSGHQLSWGKGHVDTRLFRRDFKQISLMLLGYGAEVEICASGFQDFSLVQIPLRGTTEIMSDGVTMMVSPGETAIVTPQQQVQTRWQQGCKQLLLKIPHRLIQAFETEQNPSDCKSNGLMPTQAVYKIHPQLAPQWNALLRPLLSLPALHDTKTLNPIWLDHFEINIALFLLGHQPTSAKPESSTPAFHSNKPQDKQRLNQVKNYIHAHLGEKVVLADLAQAAGISLRSLHLLCHRHVGLSPMEWLRTIRLDTAHQALRTKPKLAITDIALAHGFEHLGRFSLYYQRRFGELPRHTRSKHHQKTRKQLNN